MYGTRSEAAVHEKTTITIVCLLIREGRISVHEGPNGVELVDFDEVGDALDVLRDEDCKSVGKDEEE